MLKSELTKKLKELLRKHIVADAPQSIDAYPEQSLPTLSPIIVLQLGVLSITVQHLYRRLSEQVNPNFKERGRYQLQLALLTELGELLDVWDIWSWYRVSKFEPRNWAKGIVELADLVAFRASLSELMHSKLDTIDYRPSSELINRAYKFLKEINPPQSVADILNSIDYNQLKVTANNNETVIRIIETLLLFSYILTIASKSTKEGSTDLKLNELGLLDVAHVEIAWFTQDLINDQTVFPLDTLLETFLSTAPQHPRKAFAMAVYDIARDFVQLVGTTSIKSALYYLACLHYMYLHIADIDEENEHVPSRIRQYWQMAQIPVDTSEGNQDRTATHLRNLGTFLVPIFDAYLLKTVFNINRQLAKYIQTKDARLIKLTDGSSIEDNKILEQLLLTPESGVVSPYFIVRIYNELCSS